MAALTPPGWPTDLPPGASAEFVDRVVPWLLDQGPADLRTSDLRLMPIALAVYLQCHLEGCLAGARRAYAQARTELGADLPADELSRAQRAFEAEGARLLRAQREVGLVIEALRRLPSA